MSSGRSANTPISPWSRCWGEGGHRGASGGPAPRVHSHWTLTLVGLLGPPRDSCGRRSSGLRLWLTMSYSRCGAGRPGGRRPPQTRTDIPRGVRTARGRSRRAPRRRHSQAHTWWAPAGRGSVAPGRVALPTAAIGDLRCSSLSSRCPPLLQASQRSHQADSGASVSLLSLCPPRRWGARPTVLGEPPTQAPPPSSCLAARATAEPLSPLWAPATLITG